LLVTAIDVSPEGPGVLTTIPVAAAEALDQRRPWGEFGDQSEGRDVDTCLDGLRRNDDAVSLASQDPFIATAVRRTEARVHESGVVVGSPISGPNQIVELLSTAHSIDHDQGQAAPFVVLGQNALSEP